MTFNFRPQLQLSTCTASEWKKLEGLWNWQFTPRTLLYHHFYNTGMENLDQLVASQHPALDYYQLLKGKFDGVAFGDVQVGQISPTGVDFELPGHWEFEGISAGTEQRLCWHIQGMRTSPRPSYETLGTHGHERQFLFCGSSAGRCGKTETSTCMIQVLRIVIR